MRLCMGSTVHVWAQESHFITMASTLGRPDAVEMTWVAPNPTAHAGHLRSKTGMRKRSLSLDAMSIRAST